VGAVGGNKIHLCPKSNLFSLGTSVYPDQVLLQMEQLSKGLQWIKVVLQVRREERYL
jgi:hypothetical protein